MSLGLGPPLGNRTQNARVGADELSRDHCDQPRAAIRGLGSSGWRPGRPGPPGPGPTRRRVGPGTAGSLFRISETGVRRPSCSRRGLGLGLGPRAAAAANDNGGVQEETCSLNLAHNDDNQVKIAALGGIQAILKAMGAHADNAEVQEEACGALKSLAANAANKVKIATLGGVEAIHNAMGAHPDVDGVQEQACGALYNLAG